MTVTTDPTEQPSSPDLAPAWRPPSRPSLKPALIVVLIAVVVVFGGLALVTRGRDGPGRSAAACPRRAAGRHHAASRARRPDARQDHRRWGAAWAVVLATVVPAGATLRGTTDADGGNGPYDRGLKLAVTASPAEVVSFYKAELRHEGWGLLPGGIDSVDGGKGTELLYERADDAYYWEIAVIVTPQSPSITPALAGGDQTAPTSLLEIDLLQVEDGG